MLGTPTLFRMGLIEEGEGADALNDVIAPPVIRPGIVHGGNGDSGQGICRWQLTERSGMSYAQIKCAGELFGQGRRGAHGNEAAGIEINVLGLELCSPIQDPTEIGIALLIFHVQEDGSLIDADLHTEDGMDPGGLSRLKKRYGSMQIPIIGEGNRGEPILGGHLDDVVRR